VRGGLAALGHELLALGADGDQELVDAHGRVDGDFAPKVLLDVAVLNGSGSVFRDDVEEAWDCSALCQENPSRKGLWNERIMYL
jgi:hypothetical protein